MGNRGNRFKFFKKIKNKLNKFSEKFDEFSGFNKSVNVDKSNKLEDKHEKIYKDKENRYYKIIKNNDLNNKYSGESSKNRYIDEKYGEYIYDRKSFEGNDFKEDFEKEDFGNSKEADKSLEDKLDLINFKDFLNLNNLKNRIFDIKPKNKSQFGIAIFCLIVLIIGFSSFYFLVYQPYQEELNEAKTAKLNELNSVYTGSLSVNSNVFYLKNQINDENNLNKVKNIDVLRAATEDWRLFHLNKIGSLKDDFGRIMLSYSSKDSKNIVLNESEAKSFVNENDAKILSDVNFKSVDTVIVPISVTRLQASAGLISVGDIVDIYSLKSNKSNYSELANSSLNEDNETEINNNGSNGQNKYNNSNTSDNNSNDLKNSSLNSDDSMPISSSELDNSSGNLNKYPDISGSTVVAILRSKDSGVIDAKYSNSNNLVSGNETKPSENSSSFSTDVEELLKASITKGYDEKIMSSLLNRYGVKLSNYERASNLADLDCQYILLLEVPRTDVNFVINNMDNLILTIPMDNAPHWIIDELLDVYSNQSAKNSSNVSNLSI